MPISKKHVCDEGSDKYKGYEEYHEDHDGQQDQESQESGDQYWFGAGFSEAPVIYFRRPIGEDDYSAVRRLLERMQESRRRYEEIERERVERVYEFPPERRIIRINLFGLLSIRKGFHISPKGEFFEMKERTISEEKSQKKEGKELRFVQKKAVKSQKKNLFVTKNREKNVFKMPKQKTFHIRM